MEDTHNPIIEGCDQSLTSPPPSLLSDDEISFFNNMLSFVPLTSPPPSLSSEDSLCTQPLPTLPPDVVEEILCRLPVKLLLQLRCVCKSWNSLISHPKFIKKHLHLSTTHHIHFLSYSVPLCKIILTSYPLNSLFTKDGTTNVTQLECPPYNCDGHYLNRIVGSCNGILCLTQYFDGLCVLCNPSLGKFKELPSFQKPQVTCFVNTIYGFGYDDVNNNYKVVAVSYYNASDSIVNFVGKTEVKVYTLGTNFWKNIQEFPFGSVPVECSGKFVSGTINWLASKDRYRESPCFIVSLNLENESYEEVPKPDYGDVDEKFLILGVLRDCLCMISSYHDVWLMKEHGIKDSWTKLFTVSYMRDPSKSFSLYKAVYIFEDDQVLLESVGDWNFKLIVYDSRINTFTFTKFQNKSVYNSMHYGPEVSAESLILPWS